MIYLKKLNPSFLFHINKIQQFINIFVSLVGYGSFKLMFSKSTIYMYSVIDKWIYGVKLSFEIIDIQSPNYTKRGKYISNSYFHLMILPVNLYKFVYIYNVHTTESLRNTKIPHTNHKNVCHWFGKYVINQLQTNESI